MKRDLIKGFERYCRLPPRLLTQPSSHPSLFKPRTRLVIGVLIISVLGIVVFLSIPKGPVPTWISPVSFRIDDAKLRYDVVNDRNFLLIRIRNVGSIAVTINNITVYRGGNYTIAEGKLIVTSRTSVLTASDIDYTIRVGEIKGIGLTDHTTWESAIIITIPDKLATVSFHEDLRTNTTYRIIVVAVGRWYTEGDFKT